MGLVSWVKNIFGLTPSLNSNGIISASSIRTTSPNEYPLFSGITPRAYREFQGKDLLSLSSWDHKSILKVLRAVSPEVSQAITLYLRVFDSGYSIEVKKQNGEIHQQAKDLLFKMINNWEQVNITRFSMPNSIRSLSSRFALDALIKGAIAGELVIDKDLNVLGLEYVDPWSIEFEWNKDEKRWIPFQMDVNQKVILDIPNFIYVPVDPLGNDPYGEEQISSCIQSVIFKFMVMQDLQMAIHTNGWRRMDFEILEEAILKNAPPEIKNNATRLNQFISSQLTLITDTYKALKPDDNIVHTDSIKVRSIEAPRGGMFDPKALLDVIDNQIANGLKTFAVLLSKRFGGSTEGFTSSEMILYIKLVGGFQRIVEELFERALQLALRVQYGIVASVDMEFNKPELRTDMELAQWRAVEIGNIKKAYDYQAIGFKEMQQRLREIAKMKGPIPDDLREFMREDNKNPDEPERPTISEEEKERRRAETNRERRSGRQE